MARWLVPVVVLASLVAIRPAIAGERGPVCRQPSVVDEMTREIRDENYYSVVNPKLITETPTQDSTVVQCQVCVQLAPYDTTSSFGDQPIRQCKPHGFEVRILHSGFVVRDLK